MAKTRREKEKKERRMGSAKRRQKMHEQDSGRTALALPSGATLFQLKKAGTYRLDIIPYEITDPRCNPYAFDADSEPLKEGDLMPERTYFVHRGIGTEQSSYVCSNKTFKKKCPICDYRAKLNRKDEDNEDVIRDLAPKERQLWNVFDHSDPDAGVKIWDISYHLFGKQLEEMIKNADEEDHYEDYAHPQDGFTLKLGVAEKSFAGNTFYEVSTVEFKPRKEELDSDLLDKAWDLDAIPKEMDYDDLKKIFLQQDDQGDDDDDDDDEEDDDDKPAAKKGGKKPSKDDDDEDEPPFKVGDNVTFKYKNKKLTGEVVKIDTKKELIQVDCDDRDQPYSVDFDDDTLELAKKGKDEDDDDDDDEDDEDDDEPKKKPKGNASRSSGKKAKDEDDEDDEEDDDNGDEDDDEEGSDDDDDDEEDEDDDEDDDD